MFTPPLSTAFVVITGAVIGLITGVLTGVFASLLLRLKIGLRDVAVDGALGAIAFPLGFDVALNFHPDLVAYCAATFLVLLRVFYRFKNRRRK